MGAAWRRRVGYVRFNPAVLLDIVEKQIVVEIRLPLKEKKQTKKIYIFLGFSNLKLQRKFFWKIFPPFFH